MPATIIGNPLASGAQIIISGNPWSGLNVLRYGIQLRLDPASSGNVYVGFSGGTTARSGGMFLSGAAGSNLGILDGMPMTPGDTYFVPKSVFQVSGTYNIYARHDDAASGNARLTYEVM